MIKILRRILTGSVMLLVLFLPLHAEIVGVEQGWSNVGEPAEVIPAPFAVVSEELTSPGMRGFNEAQSVVTTMDHEFDGGFIPAGSLVDSHMIFLNSGVFLTTQGSPVADKLRKLEERGTEISSCITCLTYFDRMDGNGGQEVRRGAALASRQFSRGAASWREPIDLRKRTH